jgi:hypothetical protein
MSAVIHFALALGSIEPLVQGTWWGGRLWIPAAALRGFAIAAIFVGVLHLPRSIYLIPYVVLVSLFLYAFLRWSGLSLTELFRYNFSHIVTHIAGVLRGPASVRQLPPHY